LRHKTNEELFQLYDSDLVLRLHNVKNLSDTRKMLGKFRGYLNGYPPSPEIAKSFLASYADRAPRTLYRYAMMIKVFMKWYGDPMDDLKVKVPRSLPPYTENADIDKLLRAMENKKTHKGCIVRDTLLVELALKSGMRRGELANLEPKDIHADFLVVRNGKGGKDRVIPVMPALAQRLRNFTEGMKPGEREFKLTSPSSPMLFSVNGYQLVVMPMLTAEAKQAEPEAVAEQADTTEPEAETVEPEAEVAETAEPKPKKAKRSRAKDAVKA